MSPKQSYTHWVEINGEVVAKAFLADEGESDTRLVFVELPHLEGIAFMAAVNCKNLKPMKEVAVGMTVKLK